MVSNQSLPEATVESAEPFWLLPHRTRFLESLSDTGYARPTIYRYRLLTGYLCTEAEARGVGQNAMTAVVIEDLAKACPQAVAVITKKRMATLARRFAGYLVDAGVIEPVAPPPPVPGSPDALCAELEHWLRHHRGMYGRRLQVHRNLLKRLMAICCTATGTAGDLSSITVETVFAFLDDCPGKPGWRVGTVRNILRFLFWSGRIPHDLSNAVPRYGRRKSDSRPRHLEPEAIRKLLEAIRDDGKLGLRNYAMFLLMARLGLRAQEVIAMRLDDIDWRAGRVMVRGKGGSVDHMPLPVDVGEAIVAWLQQGRKGNSRHLFVSATAPYPPLSNAGVLIKALNNAYRETGMAPPQGKVRTHALRHGLAMRLLGQGASLEEVGDVLRHHCVRSTTVYARYDLAALRPLARPWPVPGGVR